MLGAAQLYKSDFERWPDSVDELIETGYLRESPVYVGHNWNAAQKVMLAWGASPAFAADEPSAVKAPESAKSWAAPVAKRPTYWVLSSTDAEVCKQVTCSLGGTTGSNELPAT